ncbi:MAG: ATP synthase F1 subunit gamma [Candidatus Omnitrophota bacterium]
MTRILYENNMPVPLKQIKTRIRSIENTKKVTSAMQMVSMAKLNRITKTLYALKPYCNKLEYVLTNLAGAGKNINNPLFKPAAKKEKLVLCVIASDNGLCGLYNQNILRLSEEFIKKNSQSKVSLIVVGKKALNYFKNKPAPILRTYVGLNGKYDSIISDEIAGILKHLFLSKQADEVYAAYTYFKNGVIQTAVVDKILNIELKPCLKPIEYISEPAPEIIMERFISGYIVMKARLLFLQAFVSEHAARSMAMRSATDNAKDLLKGLILLRNKVRQANITQEMAEIISSVEALRS